MINYYIINNEKDIFNIITEIRIKLNKAAKQSLINFAKDFLVTECDYRHIMKCHLSHSLEYTMKKFDLICTDENDIESKFMYGKESFIEELINYNRLINKGNTNLTYSAEIKFWNIDSQLFIEMETNNRCLQMEMQSVDGCFLTNANDKIYDVLNNRSDKSKDGDIMILFSFDEKVSSRDIEHLEPDLSKYNRAQKIMLDNNVWLKYYNRLNRKPSPEYNTTVINEVNDSVLNLIINDLDDIEWEEKMKRKIAALLVPMMILVGCSSYTTDSSSSEEIIESKTESSEDIEETENAPSNIFSMGKIDYDYSETNYTFEFVNTENDMSAIQQEHIKAEDDNGTASLWFYELASNSDVNWPSPGDDIMSDFENNFSLNTEDEPIREYSLVTSDYIIQSKTFANDENIIFDIMAMSKEDSFFDDEDTGRIYYASIISDKNGENGLFKATLNAWTDAFSAKLSSDIDIIKEKDILSYMTAKKASSSNGIIDDKNNVDTELTIKLNTSDSLSPEIGYKKGIKVLESLKNASDPDGWKSQMVPPNSNYIRNFMGICCEIQTDNETSIEKSVADLPLMAVWFDCNMGILYINDEIVKSSSDIKEIFGMPYYSSEIVHGDNDDYIVSWYYKYGDDFIFVMFNNESITDFGIINKSYAEKYDDIGMMDDIRTTNLATVVKANELKKMTLDDVKELKKKIDNITWSDLEEYDTSVSTTTDDETVITYPVDDIFTLMVTGASDSGKIESIWIKYGDEEMNIMDNVDEFVKNAKKAEQQKNVTDDDNKSTTPDN